MRTLSLLFAGSAIASVAAETTAAYTVTNGNGYKIVTVPSCTTDEYVLYPRGTTAPSLGAGYKYFATPLENVVVAETVGLTFLEQLGVRETVHAVSGYSTSACVQDMVATGAAIDYSTGYYGNYGSYAYGPDPTGANQDALLVGADALFTSSWYYDSSDSKHICQMVSSETHPLASADWVNFFALFYDLETTGASIQCDTESRYRCASVAATSTAEAAAVAAGSTYTAPKIMFISQYDWTAWGYGIGYKINMPDYKLQFIADAGGQMPDLSAYAAYNLGTEYDFSSNTDFLAAIAEADVLIDETYPQQQTTASLLTAYGITDPSTIPAFANDRVYTLDGTMAGTSAYDGTDWYESRLAMPDTMLDDLALALFPSYSLAGSEMHYLRKASAVADISVVTAAQCTVSYDTPLVSEAASCAALAEGSLDSVGSVVAILYPSLSSCSAVEAAIDAVSGDDDDDEKKKLIAAAAACGAVAGAVLIGMAVYCMMKGKAATPSKATA